MTIKIGNYQNRPVQSGSDKSVSRVGEGTAATENAGSASKTGGVQITDQARQLASLEQAVNSLPVVNEARVAQITAAIEEGRYQVDAERIADKLLRTEQDLNGQ